MLREIREYADLGNDLLLTLKLRILQLPHTCFRNTCRFLFWFSGDYDIGHFLFHTWLIYMAYLTCGIIQKYTNFFEACLFALWMFLDAIVFVVVTSTWFFFAHWMPNCVLLVAGLGAAHVQHKKKKEQREISLSFIDEEDDMPDNVLDHPPEPLSARGWGPREDDVEPDEKFVAPTKYFKISGMMGVIPGMAMNDNIVRMNQALKDKLAPGATNGPYPWVKVTMDPHTALVYIRFKTIEDATRAFKTLDGHTFDGGAGRSMDRNVGKPFHRNPVRHRRALQPALPADSFPIPDEMNNDSSSPSSSSSDDSILSTTISALLLDLTADDDGCHEQNVSCACHTEYFRYEGLERIMLGLVAVPVIMFGILANVTSMRIFTNRIMSGSSINWYLAILSASDTLILVSAFFVLALPRFGEFLTWWRANYISYSVTPYMYGLMMTAQTCSVFMTVGVSVHRYIGVCHPYKSVEWLPKKRVTSFISGLIAFAVLFNTTRFFEVHISNVCYRENIDYYMPSLQPTALRNNDLYRLIYFGWGYTLVMYVVPFSLLIGLNSMVLSAVRRSRRMHMVSQCGAESEEFSKKAERKERQTSIMLIAIVLLFIACNTLAFVCNIMENMGEDGVIYQTLVTFNNLMVIINASCNICIYMLFSDKYRMLLRYYLFCDWSRQGELLIDRCEKSQA